MNRSRIVTEVRKIARNKGQGRLANMPFYGHFMAIHPDFAFA
jgi:uncharacterized protein (UPF0128 family)